LNRLEAITRHLLAKGAQHGNDAGHVIESRTFTEFVFRKLIPSVRVRVYDGGGIEILFVEEMCPGSVDTPFHKVPEMDWVLATIDEHVKAQPNGNSHQA
jgi:hypothetical protein